MRGKINIMKFNVEIDIDPDTMAKMAHGLSTREYFRIRRLMDTKARMRFINSMHRARAEYWKSGWRRWDREFVLAELRRRRDFLDDAFYWMNRWRAYELRKSFQRGFERAENRSRGTSERPAKETPDK